MTDLLRAQVTFQHTNGLPRDAASMNYWAAPVAGADEDTALDWANAIQTMFRTIIAPRTRALASYIGGQYADAGHTIKVYDYDMETGERLSFADGPPLVTTTFPLTGVGTRTGDSMPSEVALCTTFKSLSGAVPGGGTFSVPMARRRGRTYLPSPMNGLALDEAGTNINRPGTELIDSLGTAHWSLLADHGAGDPIPWVVYSRPFAGRAAITAEARAAAGGPFRALPALAARPGQAYVIDQVSVDNAWDTQRKRGERATSRTVF